LPGENEEGERQASILVQFCVAEKEGNGAVPEPVQGQPHPQCAGRQFVGEEERGNSRIPCAREGGSSEDRGNKKSLPKSITGVGRGREILQFGPNGGRRKGNNPFISREEALLVSLESWGLGELTVQIQKRRKKKDRHLKRPADFSAHKHFTDLRGRKVSGNLRGGGRGTTEPSKGGKKGIPWNRILAFSYEGIGFKKKKKNY